MRLFLMLCLIGALPFILRKTKRRETYFLFVCYIAAVLVITLGFRTPFQHMHYRVNPLHEYMNIWRTARGGYGDGGFPGAWRAVGEDFEALSAPILNILLFVPFGYMAAEVLPSLQKLWKVLLLGLGCSLLIETTQLVTRLGWFDIADLMNNTIGVMLGYLVYRRWIRRKSL